MWSCLTLHSSLATGLAQLQHITRPVSGGETRAPVVGNARRCKKIARPRRSRHAPAPALPAEHEDEEEGNANGNEDEDENAQQERREEEEDINMGGATALWTILESNIVAREPLKKTDTAGLILIAISENKLVSTILNGGLDILLQDLLSSHGKQSVGLSSNSNSLKTISSRLNIFEGNSRMYHFLSMIGHIQFEAKIRR